MPKMTDDERDNALRKIKALLQRASAEGGAGEGEIENAMRHARKMMDRFNIEEHEVLVNDNDAQKAAYDSIKEEDGYSRANSVDDFDRRLAHVPCIICDVKFYRSKRFDKNYKEREHLIFYGMPRDVAVAISLYHELLATMRAMARFTMGEDWKKGFSSYCHGFTQRLVARAQETKKTSQAEAGTTAIVLAKDRIVEKWAQDKLSLVSARRSQARINDWNAFNRGHKDANNVSLGTNQVRSNGRSTGKLE